MFDLIWNYVCCVLSLDLDFSRFMNVTRYTILSWMVEYPQQDVPLQGSTVATSNLVSIYSNFKNTYAFLILVMELAHMAISDVLRLVPGF